MENKNDNNYKPVAPDIDRLLKAFHREHMNPSGPTEAIKEAMDPLFKILSPLAPIRSNDEAKSLWLRIPRGDISDYDSYEDLKDYGEVDTYEEYLKLWKQDYPEKYYWYRLVLVESFDKDGSLFFRGVSFGDETIISARMQDEAEPSYYEDVACELCSLLTGPAKEAISMLYSDIYNDQVRFMLPYKFRTGVIKRNILWAHNPEIEEHDMDGLREDTIYRFSALLSSGKNDKTRIGRIRAFTADQFFQACKIGYEALGYDVSGLSPLELYLKYSDGRDEGLTGKGHGLNEGPGINFDSPEDWETWFFDKKRFGGHPWEIIRGGNSTHMDLFVCHDKSYLDFLLHTQRLSKDEYEKQQKAAGYYFSISGKHRPLESVTFYTALSDAGLPVILDDAEQILNRIQGTDYVGIVPHSVIPKYCEDLFPEKYGKVIDFMHFYKEDLDEYGNAIKWLPIEKARLVSQSNSNT